MTESAFFRDLAVLMSVAGVASAVCARLKWPKVIGYILGGVLLSGNTWGGNFLTDESSIRVLAQLGVVFLMFAMGLDFSPRETAKIRHVALPVAVVDTLAMTWLGYTVGRSCFGWSTVQSLFLGVAMCDSATTMLAKVIDEMKWGGRPFAKLTLGTSVCEDIVCVGLIAIATGAAAGTGVSFADFALSIGGLALFFLATVVVGMMYVPRLLGFVYRDRDTEVLLLTILGLCFLVAFAAYRLDFSLALGAFIVGILGGMSDLRDRIVAVVAPMKAMFAAMFFVSIGLLVDPVAWWNNLGAVLIVSVAVVVGKSVNCFFAAVACGSGVKTSLQSALSLAQIGEFAFMVALLYMGRVKDPSNPMFQIAVGASILTTVLNPLLIRASDRLGGALEARLPRAVTGRLEEYRAWLLRFRSAKGSPAFAQVKLNAIRLAVVAALWFAVSVFCAWLKRIDYSRFSPYFEAHDGFYFCLLANLFFVAVLPLTFGYSKRLAEAVSRAAVGEGEDLWHVASRRLAVTFVLLAIAGGFTVEFVMININLAPTSDLLDWCIVIVLLVVAGLIGWRRFFRAGRRAIENFHESVSAEERREKIAKMLTFTVPEGTVHRLVLAEGSPAVGETVVSLDIRARTGASVVSAIRDGTTYRNIGPAFVFAAGDTLVALGSETEIAELGELLRPAE